jgi:hypothetical protein
MVQSSITNISSAFFTVCSLCAIMITVRHKNNLSKDSVINSSLSESNADVGSSKSIIEGFLRNIFAMANL